MRRTAQRGDQRFHDGAASKVPLHACHTGAAVRRFQRQRVRAFLKQGHVLQLAQE
jgi:hypothetical protein